MKGISFADVRSRFDMILSKACAKNRMFSISNDEEIIREEMRKRQDNPVIRNGLALDLRPGFIRFIPELNVKSPCVLI